MKSETETEKNPETGIAQTAGIVPQHILDFCNRIYPPHYGSAYDAQRAHLVSKRMLIEREAAAKNLQPIDPTPMPSAESILSMIRAQTQSAAPTPKSAHPEQPRNTAETHPEQPRNEAETKPEQPRNNPGIAPEQKPKQKTQPTASTQSSSKNTVPGDGGTAPAASSRPTQSGSNQNESKIDSLPPESRNFVITLLTTKSLDESVRILTTCSYPGANKISRSCLYRYRQRLLRDRVKTRAAEAKQLVDDLLSDPGAPDDQLAKAIRHIFHTRLLETINDPACALEDTLKAIQTSDRLLAPKSGK